jgi:hypothetical protein
MKKTLFTLNINKYAPEITEMTYPLMRYYADKIGADFHIITERKYPDFPVVFEKMQIYHLGKAMKNDWNIYIDSDAIIHPETPDWTLFLKKDTVAHNDVDMANIRWKYDYPFLRDGRNIASGNWNTTASDWCLDVWHPFDMTLEEAVKNIYPKVNEINTVITPSHLIDDYVISRNIAKFGLKVKTYTQLKMELDLSRYHTYWHVYTYPTEVKVEMMRSVIKQWKLGEFLEKYPKARKEI